MNNDINNKQKDEVDRGLGTMPIGKLLFKMSGPMIISMFTQACYNLIDSIFIARISVDALEALSLAFPLQFMIIALNIGTNIGMTAMISRSLGEGKHYKANEYAMHSIFLSIIYSIIFAFIGLTYTRHFFMLQTSNPNTIKAGVDYLSIILIFSFGTFTQITFEKMLQATGNSIGSMIVQLFGAIINLIFDPILIFGLLGFPALGVKGAAIATVGGQILASILGYFINKIHNKTINLDFSKFALKKQMIFDIYRIGVPSIIMDSVGSFMIFGTNLILAKFPYAIAIMGIYYKMENFVFMPLFGLNNGMIPIISYNFGARNKSRIMHAIKLSVITGIILMVFGTLIFLLIPEKIFYIFAANSEMLKSGVIAFRIISTHFCLASINIILGSVMQATKKEFYSLISYITRVAVFLPIAYVMSIYFTLNYVWLCFPISETISCIIALLLFKKTYKDRIAIL